MTKRPFTVLILTLLVGCSKNPLSPSSEEEVHLFNRCIPGYVAYQSSDLSERWSCIGYADLESVRRMDPDTLFRICSMTKSFCGVLAAILVDNGTLELDAPVARYLPELAHLRVQTPQGNRPAAQPLTLRHCLTMTGGIPVQSTLKNKKGFDGCALRDEVRAIASQPLIAEPGARFSYSNASFDIAAAAFETITGKPLETLLDQFIIGPMNLTDTGFFPTSNAIARLALPYEISADAPCKRATFAPLKTIGDGKPHFVSAAAGLFSSPRDLARFYRMLARGGTADDGTVILSPSAFALLTNKQTPDTVDTNYSLGFLLASSGWINHGGALYTYGAANPRTGEALLLLSQLTGSEAKTVFRQRLQTLRRDAQAIGLGW